jgi:RES domain-containing protein
MAEVDVKLSEIVDLTEPSVQERYGVDQEELTADDYQVCQQLADRLRAEGVEAIWTYSRADQPGGRQLVVFVDRLKEGSLFEVASIRAIE